MYCIFLDSSVYEFEIKQRETTKIEQKIISDSTSLPDLDKALFSNDGNAPSGALILFEAPSTILSNGYTIAFGQFRTVFFTKEVSLCEIMDVVRQDILGENVINTMTRSISEPIKIHDIDKSKWSQRKGVPSPEYDILLSLLVPEPELNLVTWNIESAIQQILQPILDDLGDLYSFTGKTRVIVILLAPESRPSHSPPQANPTYFEI